MQGSEAAAAPRRCDRTGPGGIGGVGGTYGGSKQGKGVGWRRRGRGCGRGRAGALARRRRGTRRRRRRARRPRRRHWARAATAADGVRRQLAVIHDRKVTVALYRGCLARPPSPATRPAPCPTAASRVAEAPARRHRGPREERLQHCVGIGAQLPHAARRLLRRVARLVLLPVVVGVLHPRIAVAVLDEVLVERDAVLARELAPRDRVLEAARAHEVRREGQAVEPVGAGLVREGGVGAALVGRVAQRAERLERDGVHLARQRPRPPARASLVSAGLGGGSRLLLLPRRPPRLLLPSGHRGDASVLRVLLGELEASLGLVGARGTLHGGRQDAALVEALLRPSPGHGSSDGLPPGVVLHRRWVLA